MAKLALKPKDKIRVAKIRNRVRDVYRNQAEDIKEGRFLHTSAIVFNEMKFLLDLLEGIDTPDPDLPPKGKKGKKRVGPEDDVDPADVETEDAELEAALE